MGSSDKFCLRWNDFESNISSSFRDLRQKEDFFDVSIAVEEDHVVRAHKVILAACSPFFRNVLAKQIVAMPFGHPHPIIYLRGITLRDLRHVLDFMYHGEVNVAQDDLNSFLAVAEDLQIKGLTQNEKNPPPPPPSAVRPKTEAMTPSSSSSMKRGDPSERENGGAPPAKKRLPSSVASAAVPRVKASPAAPPPPLHQEVDDDEIEDVTPVKSEPSTSSALHNQDDSNFDEGDEDYGEEEDYGQYGDAGDVAYDDEGNVIEPAPGTSEGSKDVTLDEMIEANLVTVAGGIMCRICGSVVKNRTVFKTHIRDLHFYKHVQYSCPVCKRVYSSKNSIAVHISKNHKELKGLDLDICVLK